MNTISSIISKINDNNILKKYETNNFITIKSEELINEFGNNQINANLKYSGKVLNIIGNIFYASQPKDYHPTKDASCLYFGDFDNDKIYITCYFNDIAISGLKENDLVQIIGNYRVVYSKK
jgi:hypothetical protein